MPILLQTLHRRYKAVCVCVYLLIIGAVYVHLCTVCRESSAAESSERKVLGGSEVGCTIIFCPPHAYCELAEGGSKV